MAKKKQNEFQNLSWWTIFAAYWGILAILSLTAPLFDTTMGFVSGSLSSVVLNGLLAVAIYKKNVLAFWLGFVITGYHILMSLMSYFSNGTTINVDSLQDLFVKSLAFFIALMLWLKIKNDN